MKFFEKTVYHYNRIQISELVIFLSDHPGYICVIEKEKIPRVAAERAKQISLLKAVRNALIEFCNQIDIKSDDLLKTVNFENCCPFLEEYLAMPIEGDKEYTEKTKNEFLEYWGF